MRNGQKIDLGMTGYAELFMTDEERKTQTLPRIVDIPIEMIQCTKMQIDRLNSQQIAYLTPSFKFLYLDPGHIDSDKECNLFRGVFDGLLF